MVILGTVMCVVAIIGAIVCLWSSPFLNLADRSALGCSDPRALPLVSVGPSGIEGEFQIES